jgi:hypothetical protein
MEDTPADAITHETASTACKNISKKVYPSIRRKIHGSPLRRTPPGWEVPNEIWRICFKPQWTYYPAKVGIGSKKFTFTPGFVEQWFCCILSTVIASGTLPIQWSWSAAFSVPKKIMSHDSPLTQTLDSRYVHSFSGLSRAVLSFAWDQHAKSVGNEPDYAQHGCIKHRRREEAIIVQETLGDRCDNAGMSTSLELFDQRNAFPSLKRQELNSDLDRFFPLFQK